MLSAKQFRTHFYVIFRLLIKTGAYTDIAYNGRVYRIQVTDTGQEVAINKRPKLNRKQKVISSKCPECKKLMINGVCMNPVSHPDSQ